MGQCERGRQMMSDANVPPAFWTSGHAVPGKAVMKESHPTLYKLLEVEQELQKKQ